METPLWLAGYAHPPSRIRSAMSAALFLHTYILNFFVKKNKAKCCRLQDILKFPYLSDWIPIYLIESDFYYPVSTLLNQSRKIQTNNNLLLQPEYPTRITEHTTGQCTQHR